MCCSLFQRTDMLEAVSLEPDMQVVLLRTSRSNREKDNQRLAVGVRRRQACISQGRF